MKRRKWHGTPVANDRATASAVGRTGIKTPSHSNPFEASREIVTSRHRIIPASFILGTHSLYGIGKNGVGEEKEDGGGEGQSRETLEELRKRNERDISAAAEHVGAG